MRLLIAGWQGQLAQALVQQAVAHPHVEACAVGRPALDLCAQPTIERALAEVRPDIVVNSAAYTAVDAAETDEPQAMALNATGAGLIARAARQRGLPIIHISTDYVFDGRKHGAYAEDDATAPQSAYGRSKLAGERAVAEANPQHVILRTSWVYSAYGKDFLKTMLRLAAERPEVSVVDDQVGNPTYAPHLADAILAIAPQLISAASPGWGLYHAAGSGATTWCGFAREIFAQAAARGRKVPTVKAIATKDYPTPASRPANSVLDCSKLFRTFGTRLPPWQDGIRHCLDALAVAESATGRPQ